MVISRDMNEENAGAQEPCAVTACEFLLSTAARSGSRANILPRQPSWADDKRGASTQEPQVAEAQEAQEAEKTQESSVAVAVPVAAAHRASFPALSMVCRR